MIDLHMHTKFSDGTDELISILEKAEKFGLEVISITDHDTVETYKVLEKIDIKKYYKGKIIPGIELNTSVLGIPIEILGYGIDYKIMDKYLKDLYIPEEERNKKQAEIMYNQCINAGIKLEEGCLEGYDGVIFASTFIRNQIKKFEENKKYITEDALNDGSIFYRKYMSNPEGILYVKADDFYPDFNKAADAIRASGGLVFIPHIFEYRENSRKILNYILENHKFDGIECYYTTFSNEQTNELLEVCKTHNLYISGGSDYHGTAKPERDMGVGFGNLSIKKEIINEWISKINIYE